MVYFKDLSLDGRPISTTYDLICQSVDLSPSGSLLNTFG